MTKLAQTSGIETPTRADLARLDRKRPKKGSNADWRHPHDPDAKITKLKDGRTHLAHKAEHAVDLDTGAVVGVTVQDADTGDAETSQATLTTAAETIETVVPDGDGLQEVVGDKGYHSNQELIDLEAVGIRSYISEPDRGRRNWTGKAEARAAVYRNRRRIHGARGQRLLRLRGERLERPFAHLYETGGLRRLYLRGHANILKRVLIHAGGLNLGLLMRHLTGVGTPRSLQGRAVALVMVTWSLIRLPETLRKTNWMPLRQIIPLVGTSTVYHDAMPWPIYSSKTCFHHALLVPHRNGPARCAAEAFARLAGCGYTRPIFVRAWSTVNNQLLPRLLGIAPLLPGSDLGDKRGVVRDTPIEALVRPSPRSRSRPC